MARCSAWVCAVLFVMALASETTLLFGCIIGDYSLDSKTHFCFSLGLIAFSFVATLLLWFYPILFSG